MTCTYSWITWWLGGRGGAVEGPGYATAEQLIDDRSGTRGCIISAIRRATGRAFSSILTADFPVGVLTELAGDLSGNLIDFLVG